MTSFQNKNPQSRINPTGMYGQVELVTPQLAAKLLETNTKNRAIRPHRIRAYCASRTEDRWYLNHQGIAIDVNGRLVDGQHRLTMVVSTGMATPMFIVRNVPLDGLHEIDAQLPRSIRDACQMAERGDFSNPAIAVAGVIERMPRMPTTPNTGITRDHIIDRLHKYGEAIAFAVDRLKGRGITRGPRALIARAWIVTEDKERIEQFCQVVTTNIPVSLDGQEDFAALTYGRLLTRMAGQTNGVLEAERYRKGQTALMSFLRRQPLEKLYGTEENLFPLPGTDADSE